MLYFTVAADQRLLWTNSSYPTVSDTLFKRGRYQSAVQPAVEQVSADGMLPARAPHGAEYAGGGWEVSQTKGAAWASA